jgi:hypothetical protein
MRGVFAALSITILGKAVLKTGLFQRLVADGGSDLRDATICWGCGATLRPRRPERASDTHRGEGAAAPRMNLVQALPSAGRLFFFFS